MTFGEALEALKDGAKVARSGWNGKGMWLLLVLDDVGRGVTRQLPDVFETRTWVGIKDANGIFGPWQPSQADMLDDDWTVIE